MSRHQLIKKMNLEDELDDFDGGADETYDEEAGGVEELSPEDQEQMREGTAKVREVIGSEAFVTDKEIQDSLWHYYYDIARTVAYIINKKAPQTLKKSKKGVQGSASTKLQGFPFPSLDSDVSHAAMQPFSAKDFFKDSPWLKIPYHRQGEISIESRYTRGGLLGGSSLGGGPKVSKLAALAAARKKKENEKVIQQGSSSPSTSNSLLDRLSTKANTNSKDPESILRAVKPTSESALNGVEPPAASSPRKYSIRKRKDPSPPPPVVAKKEKPPQEEEDLLGPPEVLAAAPSSFARTMIGNANPSPNVDPERPPVHAAALLTSFSTLPLNTAKSNAFTGPSPDDVISNAQNSKGKGSTKGSTRSAGADKTVIGVANGLGKVAIDDAPQAKSKNLDVVAEFANSKAKNAANFVVIGHVDAGKSTLMGRVLYDLKVVDQRTIDKYRKEAESIGKSSFALAWVLDSGTEERSRGVTIDIATNAFETAHTKFTILDAPGHRDFIPNMIAGASQADFAVLVIDASTGSFESGLRGQTKEHALLVRSMGVQRIIVAINKLDTVSWSQDRYTEIQQQVSAFLTTAGFLPKNVSYIPCSGLTGDNIVRRANPAEISWYEGPILIEALESSEPISRAISKPLRLTIADIFRGGVQNPLSISGRIEAGSLQMGDKIIAMPSSESAYIKAVEVDNEPVDWAVAGQNVTLHLSDIDAVHLKAGDVICPPSDLIPVVNTFTTKILAFEHITPMLVDVHRGRLHAPGRITNLVATLDKQSGAVIKKRPKLVPPGTVARVVVEMEQAVPLQAPARVVLRAGGETVAAGLLE